MDFLHFSSFLCHELSEYCNDQKKKMSGSLTESSKPVSYDISSTSSSICEIEEEDSAELFEINHGMPPMAPIKEEIESSFFSFDVHGRENHHDQEEEDIVYVAVGKSDSSLEALSWTLNHAVNASTMIYLVHVFPEIKHIPSPCKLSISVSLLCLQFFVFIFTPSRARHESREVHAFYVELGGFVCNVNTLPGCIFGFKKNL